MLLCDLDALRLEDPVGRLQLREEGERLAQQRLQRGLVLGAAHPQQRLVQLALEGEVLVLVLGAPPRELLAEGAVQRVATREVLVEESARALEDARQLQRRLVQAAALPADRLVRVRDQRVRLVGAGPHQRRHLRKGETRRGGGGSQKHG